MSYDESRRFPRIDFRNLPWIFALKLESPYSGNRALRVEAKNLGAVGMKFVSNHKIPVFSSVEISFFDKGSAKELIKLTGKVNRVEEIDTGHGEKTYGTAVEFPESGALRSLLEQTRSDQPKQE